MDKLEFDVRLARLERRVALLSIAAVTAVALLLLVGLYRMRSESTREAEVVATTVMPAPHPIPPLSPPAHVAAMDLSEGGLGQLAMRLRELANLKQESMLSGSEFDARKARLLEAPLRFNDLRSELHEALSLRDEGVLDSHEYDALRAKILDRSQ